VIHWDFNLIEPCLAAGSVTPSQVYLCGMLEALRYYLRGPTQLNLALLLRERNDVAGVSLRYA
jgi:hypothetical protein